MIEKQCFFVYINFPEMFININKSIAGYIFVVYVYCICQSFSYMTRFIFIFYLQTFYEKLCNANYFHIRC